MGLHLYLGTTSQNEGHSSFLYPHPNILHAIGMSFGIRECLLSVTRSAIGISSAHVVTHKNQLITVLNVRGSNRNCRKATQHVRQLQTLIYWGFWQPMHNAGFAHEDCSYTSVSS